MQKRLPFKISILIQSNLLITSFLLVTCLNSNGQANKEITNAKLVLVRSVPMGSETSPETKIDKDALYSNISTLEYPMPNEGDTDRSGNIITNMVADSLGFEGG